MTVRSIRLGLLALPLAAAIGVPSAEAGIICKDGFQLVAGAYIATPYCQDNLVAQVAREYGMRVSEAAIRSNPNLKRHVCRLVGQDIRINQTCLESNSWGRRGF